MKALAILVACLLAAAPAQAFMHGPGPHPGPGRGHHHGGFGLGPWGGVDFPDASAPPDLGPPPEPPFVGGIAAFATALPGPAPSRAGYAPPRPRPGPHIIYIGHKPTIRGPKVVYGVN